jgi:serine/threonine protein kinase
LSQKEPLKRPSTTDDGADEINDQFWDLIMKCCKPDSEDRLTMSEIQELLASIETHDNRPEAQSLPGPEINSLRMRPGIDWDGTGRLLSQIQVRQLTT